MFVEPSAHFTTLSPRITVMQGAAEVTAENGVMLTTVLGSCVAACLFDPIAKVGGMNHFLLAEPERREGGHVAALDEHFGLYLMELLINRMMQAGAAKSRMRAHIYGGANIHKQMRAIGSVNAAFAERFLNAEGIMLGHRDVGGDCARRVDFLAAQGKARCRHVVQSAAPPPVPVRKRPENTGDVEFF